MSFDHIQHFEMLLEQCIHLSIHIGAGAAATLFIYAYCIHVHKFSFRPCFAHLQSHLDWLSLSNKLDLILWIYSLFILKCRNVYANMLQKGKWAWCALRMEGQRENGRLIYTYMDMKNSCTEYTNWSKLTDWVLIVSMQLAMITNACGQTLQRSECCIIWATNNLTN